MVAQAREAVRLNHTHDAPCPDAFAGGREHRANFDRVMGVVVDHGDPVDLAHPLEAPVGTVEGSGGLSQPRAVNAQQPTDRVGSRGVEQVVPPGDHQ